MSRVRRYGAHSWEVTVDGVDVTVEYWSDDNICAYVPLEAKDGNRHATAARNVAGAAQDWRTGVAVTDTEAALAHRALDVFFTDSGFTARLASVRRARAREDLAELSARRGRLEAAVADAQARLDADDARCRELLAVLAGSAGYHRED